MGLLSGILTVGGAVAGGLIGGPAGASLGASLGGAVGGGIDKSKATKGAAKDLRAAEERARLEKEKAYGRVTEVQAPFLGAGPTGMNALTGRLQVGPTAPAAGYAATSADDRRAASGYGDGTPYSAEDMATLNYKPAGGSAGTSPVEQNALTSPGTYGSATNPAEPAGYTPDAAPPAYGGAGAAPSYTAPQNFSYGLEDYTASPGYQYRQDQARKGILASASATGALQSGAALKELYDRGDQIAYQDFGQERAFAASRSDADRAFGYTASRDQRGDYEDTRDFGYGQTRDARSDYNSDRDFGYGASRDERSDYQDNRNYLTDRFDQGTNDLFRYTDIGRQAAGVVSNAATGYGSDMATSARNTGDINAGNALQQGSIWSGVTGDVAGSIAGYYAGKKKAA